MIIIFYYTLYNNFNVTFTNFFTSGNGIAPTGVPLTYNSKAFLKFRAFLIEAHVI